MKLNDYQKKAATTAKYPKVSVLDSRGFATTGCSWVYPALGLGGETGEILEKLKKILRDCDGQIGAAQRDAIALELGDLLWYISTLASELGVSLEEVATANLSKLQSRSARCVLSGEGDYR